MADSNRSSPLRLCLRRDRRAPARLQGVLLVMCHPTRMPYPDSLVGQPKDSEFCPVDSGEVCQAGTPPIGIYAMT